jgi:hypothetical protein
LSWRSPERFSRWRVTCPEDAGIGLAPAKAANAASERSRPAYDQLTRTWAALIGPTPGSSSDLEGRHRNLAQWVIWRLVAQRHSCPHPPPPSSADPAPGLGRRPTGDDSQPRRPEPRSGRAGRLPGQWRRRRGCRGGGRRRSPHQRCRSVIQAAPSCSWPDCVGLEAPRGASVTGHNRGWTGCSSGQQCGGSGRRRHHDRQLVTKATRMGA